MKKLALAASVIAMLALSSVALAAGLSGTYKTKIHTSALNGAVNGTWTIKFKAGHYTVTDNGSVVLQGKYSTRGSKITVGGGTAKDDFCKARGTYKFKVRGSKLTFSKISDSHHGCGGRVAVLTKGHFSRIG